MKTFLIYLFAAVILVSLAMDLLGFDSLNGFSNEWRTFDLIVVGSFLGVAVLIYLVAWFFDRRQAKRMRGLPIIALLILASTMSFTQGDNMGIDARELVQPFWRSDSTPLTYPNDLIVERTLRRIAEKWEEYKIECYNDSTLIDRAKDLPENLIAFDDSTVTVHISGSFDSNLTFLMRTEKRFYYHHRHPSPDEFLDEWLGKHIGRAKP
jgi:hypothetical protein